MFHYLMRSIDMLHYSLVTITRMHICNTQLLFLDAKAKYVHTHLYVVLTIH